MKNRISKYLRHLTLMFILVISVNCEKEIAEPNIGTEVENTDFKLNQGTFNEMFKTPMFKKGFLETMEIKSVLQKINYANKTGKKDIYDFTIDSSTIKQATINKITSFSMLIKRKETNNSFFENLAIKIDSLGQTKAYLIKYTYTSKPTYNPDHNSKSFEGTTKVTTLDPKLINNESGKIQHECTSLYSLMCNNDGKGNCNGSWHPAENNCNSCIVLKQSGISCGYYDDEAFNLGEGGTTNTSGGGDGTNNNVGDEDLDQLVVVPVDCKDCALPVFEDDVFDVETIAIKLELSIAEADFLKTNNSLLIDVANFLIVNNNSEGENFARNAIKVLINGYAKEKEVASALLKGNTDLAMDLLLEGAEVPNYLCPNPPCPEDVAEAIIQDVVVTINNAFDGELNILIMLHDYFLLDLATRTLKEGAWAKRILEEAGADISSDVSLWTLGELFKVRIRGRKAYVEPANQDLWDTMSDVGTSIFDVAVLASPIKGGGAYGLLVKTGGSKITAASMVDFLKTYKTIATTTLQGGRGYESFYLLKKAIGKLKAKDGHALHHIVEQNGHQKLNPLKFGKKNIHNTKNIIEIPTGAETLHNNVTSHYLRKFDFTNGKTVREWISSKSFQEQYDYGIKILKQEGWDGIYGIIK